MILVIDDFAGFRQTIKTMLARLGVQHVDQASSGNEAIKRCEKTGYDIIFCDYNLGEGQDGQQILEELLHRKLLRRGALFLMVTAETTRAQVMGAVEYRPDAYLTKPFTGEQLGQRLKRLFLKNEILQPLYEALNEGAGDRAIALCDQIATRTPKVKYSCLRIKSELLEQNNELDEVLDLYRSVTNEQPLLWAMIGIGRVYYRQGQIEQALQQFEAMRDDFAEQVSVLDWIARCRNKLGDLDGAEKTLVQAIQLSPKSVTRQAFLGQVASQLKHTAIAQKAFSKTIYEGHHSCMLKPEYYRQYYDITRELAAGLSGRELSRLVAESETMHKKMERKYSGDPAAMAASLSAAARLYSDIGKEDKSNRLLSKLASTLQQPECNIDGDQLQYIEATLQSLPQASAANSKSLARISSQVSRLKQRFDEQQKQLQDAIRSARELNSQGLAFARQKQPREALEKFRQAINTVDDNTNYCLNAAQIIVEHKDLKQDTALIEEARTILTSRIDINPGDVRWKRYQKLLSDLPEATNA